SSTYADDAITVSGGADATGFAYTLIQAGSGTNTIEFSAASSTAWVTSDTSDTKASLGVSIADGSSVNFLSSLLVTSLTMDGSAQATLTSLTPHMLRAGSLSLGSTSKLD